MIPSDPQLPGVRAILTSFLRKVLFQSEAIGKWKDQGRLRTVCLLQAPGGAGKGTFKEFGGIHPRLAFPARVTADGQHSRRGTGERSEGHG